MLGGSGFEEESSPLGFSRPSCKTAQRRLGANGTLGASSDPTVFLAFWLVYLRCSAEGGSVNRSDLLSNQLHSLSL